MWVFGQDVCMVVNYKWRYQWLGYGECIDWQCHVLCADITDYIRYCVYNIIIIVVKKHLLCLMRKILQKNRISNDDSGGSLKGTLHIFNMDTMKDPESRL